MTPAPLILVVGPSGAGKDSLMDGARRILADDGRFHFARRVVTRPVQAEAEDHDSVSPEQFARIEAAGGFALSWAAHNLAYGVPASIAGQRREGATVVVNVSRQVVDMARRTLAPVGIIIVTAPLDVLAARLSGRGRETADDIRHRLARAASPMAESDDTRLVVNDSSLEAGVDRFLGALHSLCRHHP